MGLLMLRAFVLLALAPSGCSASRSSPVELLARRHWGVNIHSNSWSPSSAALLRTAFTAIRQDFAWADVEKQRGVYDWSTYETLLDQLGPGVVPYIILDYGNALYGTNATASNDWIVIEKNNTVASEAFVKFAVNAMRRFKGKGVMWELWNEPNGQWCCGHLEPEVYGELALAIASEKAKLSPELDDEVLAGPTTCGCDLAYMESVFKTGALSALSAISWHPYRSGGPESVTEDYAAIRTLAKKYLPSNATAVPPIISSEWGWATCFTAEGDPAPCIGGATGGSTVSRSQQGAFLDDWSDGDACIVTDGGSSDCYGVFSRPGPSPGPGPPSEQEAHGQAKPAFHAAVTIQSMFGTRQVVKRLKTAAPPPGETVEAGSDPVQGSKCLSINTQAPSMAGGSIQQDAAGVFVVAFAKESAAAPPAAKAPKAAIDAFALWSVSDFETSTTIVEPSLASACFNRTSLYGVRGTHSYCFNATGRLHAGLLTQPELYTRVSR